MEVIISVHVTPWKLSFVYVTTLGSYHLCMSPPTDAIHLYMPPSMEVINSVHVTVHGSYHLFMSPPMESLIVYILSM